MVLFVILTAIAPYLTGLSRLRAWSIAIWPVIHVALGAYGVANESPNYDMHGFALGVGIILAGAALVGWLAGRVTRQLWRRRRAATASPVWGEGRGD
ncbi:MAG: hypothetical protein JW895_01010 [Thermoleophilaceae bacterium]|nr:hypothetical protein [Thermoleophilaceae bacterium]